MVAKVADFGVVREMERHGLASQQQTMSMRTTTISGTTCYMPREYILMGEVSVKIDSFAMGVVVLEELTGRPPADVLPPDMGSVGNEDAQQPLYILLEDLLDDHRPILAQQHQQCGAGDCECDFSLGGEAVEALDGRISWPHKAAHQVACLSPFAACLSPLVCVLLLSTTVCGFAGVLFPDNHF
jgi:serine/threonine protein kinase